MKLLGSLVAFVFFVAGSYVYFSKKDKVDGVFWLALAAWLQASAALLN